MSWSLLPTPYTFVCDSECGANKLVPAKNFVEAWPKAQAAGWVSFKRVGHQWTYHCAACAEKAKREHEDLVRKDEARERLRQRIAEGND